MARPITDAERQVLMDHPELVMFKPRRLGLEPVVFLLVIPVVTMALLAGVLFLTGAVFYLVDTAPVISTLVFVAVCSLMPFVCLRIKNWYDEAYGIDRELRALLREERLVVQVVRITGFVPQQAELYAETDEGPLMFGVASTVHTFVPEVGERMAVLYTDEVALGVRPDPLTQSLLED